ncbi:MAG: transcriptional regulator [Nitrosopumilaceae archaeon]|nr:transcriptional regulator [Nitrosopumilaceae archaeon]
MDKRKSTGITIFLLCIGGFFLYAYLLMLSEWSPVIMQLSVLMIVGAFLGIIAWIGYTMATTKRSPASISFDDE